MTTLIYQEKDTSKVANIIRALDNEARFSRSTTEVSLNKWIAPEEKTFLISTSNVQTTFAYTISIFDEYLLTTYKEKGGILVIPIESVTSISITDGY